jgi:hypothetical protein
VEVPSAAAAAALRGQREARPAMAT